MAYPNRGHKQGSSLERVAMIDKIIKQKPEDMITSIRRIKASINSSKDKKVDYEPKNGE